MIIFYHFESPFPLEESPRLAKQSVMLWYGKGVKGKPFEIWREIKKENNLKYKMCIQNRPT